jgi:hypothetical protein
VSGGDPNNLANFNFGTLARDPIPLNGSRSKSFDLAHDPFREPLTLFGIMR